MHRRKYRPVRQISIHALLAESDSSFCKSDSQCWHFYPRSPCGERLPSRLMRRMHGNFYPRSPCGERPGHPAPCRSAPSISIHALLAESDGPRFGCAGQLVISIHALLAESDKVAAMSAPTYCLFLSTLSLRRATHGRGPALHGEGDFYPRSPCGERRNCRFHARTGRAISIHALLAESDCRALPQTPGR